MATRDAEFIDLTTDPVDLYEAWSLKHVYSFNCFCFYFFVLDIPAIVDRSLYEHM